MFATFFNGEKNMNLKWAYHGIIRSIEKKKNLQTNKAFVCGVIPSVAIIAFLLGPVFWFVCVYSLTQLTIPYLQTFSDLF